MTQWHETLSPADTDDPLWEHETPTPDGTVRVTVTADGRIVIAHERDDGVILRQRAIWFPEGYELAIHSDLSHALGYLSALRNPPFSTT